MKCRKQAMAMWRKNKSRFCDHVFKAPDMIGRDKEGLVTWPCSKCSYVARVPYGLAVPGRIEGPWGKPPNNY